jgi:hypothetical protein
MRGIACLHTINQIEIVEHLIVEQIIIEQITVE